MKNKFISYFLPFVFLAPIVSCNKQQIVKVTFKFNNADPDVVMEINKGSKITNAPIAKKYGCTFLNYRKDNGDFDLNASINEDATLSAHYAYNEEELFKNRDNPSVRKGEDANLRVMSFNLLSSVFDYHPYHHGYNERNEAYPSGVNDGRDVQAFKTIMRYMPDVIGLQECDLKGDTFEEEKMPDDDTGWYNLFKEKHTSEGDNFPYIIINEDKPKFDGKTTLFSTIAYNDKTVELERKDDKPCYGSILSVFSDNDHCRALTWAVFHLKSDANKRFMVTSTHWNLKSTCNPEIRVAQALESAHLTLKLQKEFNNIPVITTGDYNRNETEDPYKAFVKESNFNDSKYLASTRGFTGISYHIGEGDREAKEGNYRTKKSLLCKDPDAYISIDHLFLSPNVKCHYYDMIPELDALHSSDHMPSYTDVTI